MKKGVFKYLFWLYFWGYLCLILGGPEFLKYCQLNFYVGIIHGKGEEEAGGRVPIEGMVHGPNLSFLLVLFMKIYLKIKCFLNVFFIGSLAFKCLTKAYKSEDID